MEYRAVVRDPAGNALRICTGEFKPGQFKFDFRQPGMIGGAIVGTIELELKERKENGD